MTLVTAYASLTRLVSTVAPVVRPPVAATAAPVATVVPGSPLISAPTTAGGAVATFDVVIVAPALAIDAWLDTVAAVWNVLPTDTVDDVRVDQTTEQLIATVSVAVAMEA
jgi:hypothetical protein